MNLQKIEMLIKKYEQGNTSLEEENLLMDFFSNEEVPYQLRSYMDLFYFMDSSKKEELADEHFDDKVIAAITNNKPETKNSTKKIRMYSVFAIAASITILIGLYFRFGYQLPGVQDTYDDPVLAYAETKKILLKVSGNFNAGVDELKNVSEFNNGINELNKLSTFDEGIQNLEKISMLEKSKEIITTKTN
jgi:hypothetical protein